MKKLFFVLIVLLGIMTSCTKNFEDFNTDKKHNVVVPGENVFANAQKALSDQIASTNVNVNIWKLWAQYWTETTYTDEANYDIVNRTIADGQFRIYYRDILMDLKNASTVIGAQTAIGVQIPVQKNKLAIVDIMQVYAYSELLEIFGNIPYSEALDITNIYPKYDDALGVYKDLLARLDADLAILDPSAASFGSADLYMGGDVAMWKKFANSLKVRIGITIADGDNATAKAAVESGYAGAFAPDEICALAYLDATNANPLYVDLVQSGRHDFVITNTLVDMMNSLADPRRPAYMTPKPDTTAYIGGAYGQSDAFTQYSHIADPIQEATFPNTIIDGVEISFYLAEAAERGYSVGGTAKSYYDKAVTASFVQWGLTATDATAYLATPKVDYAATTSGATWKEKIGKQAWLAYYNRGLRGYTSWRRLDFPIMNIAPTITSLSEIPVRFTYPVNEQTLNPLNYAAASTAIGGDLLTTKLFWDKY